MPSRKSLPRGSAGQAAPKLRESLRHCCCCCEHTFAVRGRRSRDLSLFCGNFWSARGMSLGLRRVEKEAGDTGVKGSWYCAANECVIGGFCLVKLSHIYENSIGIIFLDNQGSCWLVMAVNEQNFSLPFHRLWQLQLLAARFFVISIEIFT